MRPQGPAAAVARAPAWNRDGPQHSAGGTEATAASTAAAGRPRARRAATPPPAAQPPPSLAAPSTVARAKDARPSTPPSRFVSRASLAACAVAFLLLALALLRLPEKGRSEKLATWGSHSWAPVLLGAELEATWTQGHQHQHRFALVLEWENVTAETLGDVADPSDEVSFNHSSPVYRAMVPAKKLWLASQETLSQKGTLRIFSEGRPLVEHGFHPLGWRSEGPSLGAMRLCYALESTRSVQAHEAYDCEHGRRTPNMVALSKANALPEQDIEVLVRSRQDPQVLASLVTEGCSSCRGQKHIGCQPRDEHASFAARVLATLAGRRCFGHPARLHLAWGIFFLAVSLACLSCTAAAPGRGLAASAVLAASAAAVGAGLLGWSPNFARVVAAAFSVVVVELAWRFSSTCLAASPRVLSA